MNIENYCVARVSEYWVAHYNKQWWLHRLDGPALEAIKVDVDTGVEDEWYYMGQKMDCKSQEEYEIILSLKAFW